MSLGIQALSLTWIAKSLDEFSGDKLERNLKEQMKLPTEVAPLTKLIPYAQISQWEFDHAEQVPYVWWWPN